MIVATRASLDRDESDEAPVDTDRYDGGAVEARAAHSVQHRADAVAGFGDRNDTGRVRRGGAEVAVQPVARSRERMRDIHCHD
jgi:hypothetical protein